MLTIAPDAVQKAAAAVLAREKGKPGTTHLYVHMPVPGLPRTTITTDSQAVHANADGTIAGPEENAWSEFLHAAPHALNIPGLVGLPLVGILVRVIVAPSWVGGLA